MSENEVRRQIIDHCLMMNSNGLNQGVAGNISVRLDDRMLITPTSIPYDRLHVEDIVTMRFDA